MAATSRFRAAAVASTALWALLVSCVDAKVSIMKPDKVELKTSVEVDKAKAEWRGPRKLLYDHMPKASGTFLTRLLRAAVGGDNFEVRSEFQNLTHEDMAHNFVIGSTRNPCDYYLSLWAYGVEHGGAMMSKIPEEQRWVYHTKSQFKNSTKDVTAFHKWIRSINVIGQPGVMSVRFARSFSRMSFQFPASAPPSVLDVIALHAVKRSMSKEQMLLRVDCWVRTENLNEDAKHCLQRYHNSTGNEIDWEAYKEAHASANQLASTHGRCEQYFDDETAALVWDLEEPLFEYFNYSTCCAPSDA